MARRILLILALLLLSVPTAVLAKNRAALPPSGTTVTTMAPQAPVPAVAAIPEVPAGSGTGRRIVYSLSVQRVWLVEANESVAKSHLVTGNPNFPRPGSYTVFSKSERSRSGVTTFRHMVRFTRSSTGLGVGFHSIPVRPNGTPIQSEAQLGQAIGRGCVRQTSSDAEFLFNWAPVGTRVVVVR